MFVSLAHASLSVAGLLPGWLSGIYARTHWKPRLVAPLDRLPCIRSLAIMAQLNNALSPSSEQPGPKLSALAVHAPRPGIPRKRPASAPCVVVIHKITDEASRFWEEAPCGCALWQMQIDHQASDSVSIGFYDKFTRFLVESENAPDTLEELRRNFIKLVVTGCKDPDQVRGSKSFERAGGKPISHHILPCIKVGLRRFRPCLYVCGDIAALQNGLELLDEYLMWAYQGQQMEVELFPGQCADVNKEPLRCAHVNVYAPAVKAPLAFWEASPLTGARWLTCTVESGDTACSFIFSGATWPMKDIFEERCVQGFYFESEGEKQYYRVLPAVTLEDKLLVTELISALRVALRVVIHRPIAAAWVEALRNPFVHFV